MNNEIEKDSKKKLPNEIDILIFFDFIYHSRYFIIISTVLIFIVLLIFSINSNTFYNHSYSLKLNQEIIKDDRSFNNQVLAKRLTNEIGNVHSINIDQKLYETLFDEYGEDANLYLNNFKISEYLFNEESQSLIFADIFVENAKDQSLDYFLNSIIKYYEESSIEKIISELKREKELKASLINALSESFEKEMIDDTIYFQLQKKLENYENSEVFRADGSFVDNISFEIAVKRLNLTASIAQISEIIEFLEDDSKTDSHFYFIYKNYVESQKTLSFTVALMYTLYFFIGVIFLSIIYHLVSLYVKHRAL